MDHLKSYADFLNDKIKPAKPISVIFDCSNGTAGMVIDKLSGEGLTLKVINEKPDGNFPAHGPNPMAEGALNDLAKAIKKAKADFGVAFDADGDRAFFVDDLGRPVPPDAALFLLSESFSGPIVIDWRAGYLARELLGRSKKRVIESRVGHYFIKKVMKEQRASFGGELSGHYYFPLDGGYFDSGILAAVNLINAVSVLKKDGAQLSGWIDSLPVYYRSGEINFLVADKQLVMEKAEAKYKESAEKITKLDGLRMEFSDWWFVLRPSQTENLLRLVMEAKDQKVLDQRLAELKSLLLTGLSS